MNPVINKVSLFLTASILLIIGAIVTKAGYVHWDGHSSAAHSLLQSIASVIALFCGAAALYRYYSGQNKSSMLFFIGVGFLATTIIDTFHTVVTSLWFAETFPQVPEPVARWSWWATRLFLSVLMMLSLIGALRGKDDEPVNEKKVYFIIGALTIIALIFFTTVHVPYPRYAEEFIGRPLEFIPGLFFLIALIGYLKKGKWKTDQLEFWIVFSLITAVICQFAYMSLSGHLYDAMFQVTHVVKIIGYTMVYLGVTS